MERSPSTVIYLHPWHRVFGESLCLLQQPLPPLHDVLIPAWAPTPLPGHPSRSLPPHSALVLPSHDRLAPLMMAFLKCLGSQIPHRAHHPTWGCPAHLQAGSCPCHRGATLYRCTCPGLKYTHRCSLPLSGTGTPPWDTLASPCPHCTALPGTPSGSALNCSERKGREEDRRKSGSMHSIQCLNDNKGCKFRYEYN